MHDPHTITLDSHSERGQPAIPIIRICPCARSARTPASSPFCAARRSKARQEKRHQERGDSTSAALHPETSPRYPTRMTRHLAIPACQYPEGIITGRTRPGQNSKKACEKLPHSVARRAGFKTRGNVPLPPSAQDKRRILRQVQSSRATQMDCLQEIGIIFDVFEFGRAVLIVPGIENREQAGGFP